MIRTKRSRDPVAASPEVLAAYVDGGGGVQFINQVTVDLQAASATAPARCVHRPVYLLGVQAQPGIDDIRALRWALKKLLRLGLRCISIEVRR
jgi:hypothetical protein